MFLLLLVGDVVLKRKLDDYATLTFMSSSTVNVCIREKEIIRERDMLLITTDHGENSYK